MQIIAYDSYGRVTKYEIMGTEDKVVATYSYPSENLIKIHKKNGTDIIIDGKLPQNKETAKVFFEIIREATTNAIRHAGSSKVFVNIKETLEETYMIITNDGRKPNEFITENQGIKDMRRKVKKLGGMFYISTVPEFSVNISIKNNC